MRITDWLKPGIKVKRWIAFGLLGILLIAFGFTELVNKRAYYVYYKIFYLFLNLTGIFVIYVAVTEVMKSVIMLMSTGYVKLSLDSRKIESLIGEKRLLVKGPKIVVIGGGTGLSTMLRGLKYYTSNITAIVTVGDNGGGSGALREDLGILPPGDIRNCILALADTEPIMEDLLQYRFTNGRLKNQSFGNLFLAAMDGISDNFEDAVQKMSSVLAVTGKVLPVTLDDMQLIAELENGNKVLGESEIPNEAIKQKSRIKKLMIEPKEAEPVKEALIAIKEADAIIIGPGSLYTSVISNFLINNIGNAVCKSNALKIYVSNIMTQPGETDGFDVAMHLKNGIIPEDLIEKYKSEGSELVKLNKKELKGLNAKCIEADLVKIKDGHIKHNTDKLAEVLVDVIMEKKLQYDKKKIIEYMYLSQRIRAREIEEKKNHKDN